MFFSRAALIIVSACVGAVEAANAASQSQGTDACGEDGVHVPSLPVRDDQVLASCLDEAFPAGREDLVTLFSNGDGPYQVKKITTPRDGEAFENARYNCGRGLRWPAAIVYAASTDEVVKAVNCATSAGYNISPRSRGHHYQGFSVMDGYVVIDVSLLCNPDEFVLDRTEDSWLLPGQKKIGNILNGAGCTNAVMLAYAHKNFEPEEGGLYAIGTCPSVGITGYSTGGGSGDITPYVGWGADDVLSVEVVLYDGKVVTASKDENADLFWATQGGGSGFGVITKMQTVVIQSPEPPQGKDRKFCYFLIFWNTPDDDSRKEHLNNFQTFLYDNPESIKFGGGGTISENWHAFQGIFLGGRDELVEIVTKAGLFSQLLADEPAGPSVYSEDYVTISTPDGLPEFGVEIRQFSSYGEAMMWKICDTFDSIPANAVLYAATSLDYCADLGLDAEKCVEKEDEALPKNTTLRYPRTCLDPEVIEAFVEAAYNPASFFNRPGELNAFEQRAFPTRPGGLLVPRVNVDVLNELAKVGLMTAHFQHGAPMSVAPDATALAHRDTAIMTDIATVEHFNQLTSILATMHYEDETELQGYLNYPNPIGNPNWRKYYFGDKYERLAAIKLKYDPLNVFGNPLQVQPATAKTITNAEGTGVAQCQP